MFVVILRKLCLVRKSEETTVWVWRLLLEVSEHWELMTPCRMWRELLNSIQKVSMSSAVTAWHGYWSNTYNLKMVLYKLRIFTHRVIMTEIMGQISVVDLVISFKRVLIFWSACGLQISPMLIGTELLRNNKCGEQTFGFTKMLRLIQQNAHFSVSDVGTLDTLCLEEHVNSD